MFYTESLSHLHTAAVSHRAAISSIRLQRDSDEAAGLTCQPPHIRGRLTDHRREQLVVTRPIGNVPLSIHVHDEDATQVGVVACDRRDVPTILISGQHPLIEIDENDVPVAQFVLG